MPRYTIPRTAHCESGALTMAALRLALPRRTRLRLWLTRQVDNAGYWLVCHDHLRAAGRLWRTCGRW